MMPLTPDPKNNAEQPLPLLEVIVEIYAWLQIVFASVVLGLIVGFIIYYAKPGKSRLTLAIVVTATALLIGIVLATRAWKKNRKAYMEPIVAGKPNKGPEEEKVTNKQRVSSTF